jgi:anti-sigma regulatory factor (Ser/Thr protein kinase)
MARLVVSELATNAWRHGDGQIILRVFRDTRAGFAVLEVWDEGAGQPMAQGEDDDAESGRGLLLTSELVHDWGVRPLNEEGKIVWATLAR